MSLVRIGKLAKDTAVLTGASLFMRCIGLAYQMWLAGAIGPAGIGLWQLVMSVSMLSATLAISGIRFTATRLVAEELGSGNPGGARAAMRRCLTYACFFGCAALLLLFFSAERIGFLWVGDARTVKSLRIIAFTLPLISMSSVLNGYFIASGHAWKSAVVQIAEQLAGVAAVMLFLHSAAKDDLETCCAAISRANLLADAISLFLIASLYIADCCSRHRSTAGQHLTRRMLRIALPLACSAYARTSLTTLENLLVPRKLRDAGFSADKALSGYGSITGMVFPIIGFPACLLSAAAELIVPELTAAQVRGDMKRIRSLVLRLLRDTLLYSGVVALMMFVFAGPLGRLIGHSEAIGRYLRIFAFLVPIMYMDIVTDGCLKGLGQMLWSMGFNISEACIGVLLVITVLPVRALSGYIFVIFFCECFNFTLSISRLYHAAGFGLCRKNRPD